MRGGVENDLALNPDIYFASFALELPGIQSTPCREADVYASVSNEILWLFWKGVPGKIFG